MAAFTASQASVTNGSKVVQINSGESVANVSSGDFLVLAGFIVEINRAYVGSDSKGYFELVKNWPNSNQSNQECIVIPTTGEFKKAVDALTNANVLVNDNFKALQDWQTKMDTVTFSNQDGTTTTVKTLKQIEADNLAQMNAYHPHPWAMRKVEFEAMRAANNEKFAASGFEHFGKMLSNLKFIAEGMGVSEDQESSLKGQIGIGARNVNAIGNSKTDFAQVNIAGVITELDSLSSTGVYGCRLKLAPEEVGTRTYDSATGVSVTHATPAIAFASETETNKVVTDREDVWGIYQEVREINEEYPFVYKNGLPQSLAPDIDGVPTVSNNVQSIEYFAQYDGDISSRGKGVNWLTATEEERRTIASNPKNKIKFDDQKGKFYQTHNFAITFRGIGNGSWQFVDVQNTATLRFDLKTPVTNSDGSYFTGYNNAKYNKECIGVYQKVKGNDLVEDSYLLLCGTVNRRNTGLYHDSFNKLGTAKASDDREWHNTAQSFTSKSDCFDPAKLLAGSGSIASGKSGAPDGRYYDAIYASGLGGVCRDMRYSAWGLTAEDFAEQDLKIKSGEYRGSEKLPFSVPIVAGPNSITTYISLGETKPSWWDDSILGSGGATTMGASDNYLYNPTTGEKLFVWLAGYTSTSGIGWYLRTVKALFATGTTNDDYHNLESGDVLILQTTCDTSLSNISVSGEYTHTEVIGDPADILLCDDLKDGWIGGWIPELPSTEPKNYELTRPSVSTPSILETTDLGNTWANITTGTWDSTKNTFAGKAMVNDSILWLLNYTVKARSTKPVGNTKILGGIVGLGSVFASMDAGIKNARYLAFSLISKILTYPANTSNVGQETLTLLSSSFLPSQGILWANNKSTGENKHTPLSLGIPTNAGPAFKALDYKVVENQQAFINYTYTELTYDAVAGDWGDDSKIHPVDNQATMLDENGKTVLVGTAQCVEPLGWLKNDK